ncbi:MAG: hypothetical protein ACW99G_20165 [Candidatus Thorarchaeota archaeon]
MAQETPDPQSQLNHINIEMLTHIKGALEALSEQVKVLTMTIKEQQEQIDRLEDRIEEIEDGKKQMS